jgi:hypothetical protein
MDSGLETRKESVIEADVVVFKAGSLIIPSTKWFLETGVVVTACRSSISGASGRIMAQALELETSLGNLVKPAFQNKCVQGAPLTCVCLSQ